MSRILDTTTHMHEANGEKKPRHAADLDCFDDLLEWLLTAGSAAMGERGTLGGIVNALELGGYPGGVPNTDIYSDQQVGWRNVVVGLVERHRWLSHAWFLTGQAAATEWGPAQGLLLGCYVAPRAAFRSDEQSGARAGTEAQLGRLAGLAFALTPNPAKLFVACQDPQKGTHARTIGAARMLARKAAVAGHRIWDGCKREARHPRPNRDRRAILPAFVPHDPWAEVE